MNKTRELVMTALGQASMCWSKPDKAGVFNSTLAEQIGDKLVEDIRRVDQKKKAKKKKKK